MSIPIPKIFLKTTIHFPGFGKQFKILGNKATSNHGIDNPIPIDINIKIMLKLFSEKANVIAVPTNGAEHGVANKVAKKPFKKSLKFPVLLFGTIFKTSNGNVI